MTRARPGALLLVLSVVVLAGLVGPAAGRPEGTDGTASVIIAVADLSFDELFGVREVAALARVGGAGLLVGPGPALGRSAVGGLERSSGSEYVVLDGSAGLDAVGADVRDIVETSPAEELLVIVVGGGRSAASVQTKDETHPIVLAVGPPPGLLDKGGDLGSLTSDSTRRDGVVVWADAVLTAAAHVGADIGFASEEGSPIQVIDGPPPFELHDRYLAQRRMYVPIGTAAGLYVTAAGLAAVAFVGARRRVPVSARRVAGWAALTVPMLAAGLLAAGHLADPSYSTVVPMVAIVTVFGTMAFAPLERRDLTLVPAGIGVAVLALLALEAVLGWSAALTPFLGGSHLDGGRFFGLPNAYIGLLIGASLWVAQRLTTTAGFALICAVALFAGLPDVGANLGGAISLFGAAGLWLAVRERERLGAGKGVAVLVGVAILGTATVILAHAVSPAPTHITRFEERVGGPAGAWETFADRMQVGFDLIARNPAALVPVLGLLVALVVVVRPPAAIRETFEAWPGWRDAVLVTLLAGIVAYLANDSGPAAAGLAFGLGLGGMLGVSLLAGAGKMGER